MFNAATNKLLEKTNEELSTLHNSIQLRLSAIEDKLNVKPSSTIANQNRLLSFIMLTGLLLLVILYINDQSRMGSLKKMAEQNNQAIQNLNSVITANTSAFNEMKTTQSNTTKTNADIQQSLDKLNGQNAAIINSNTNLSLQYRALQKRIDLFIQKEKMPVETSYIK